GGARCGAGFARAIAATVSEATGESAPSPARTAEVPGAARRAKEALSTADTTTLEVEGHQQTFTREDLAAWIRPLVERTGRVCRRALRDAELCAGQLDGVILVGGSTRTPAVRDYVAELFGREARGDIDADRVVALGAAVQAGLVTHAARGDEGLLLDVTPLSRGLETLGGVAETVIPRNRTLPIAAAQVFTTFQEGQNAMDH